MNEMLLRGCMLKNSGFITGLVVYTGKETRIQMNAAKTPLKVGEWRSRRQAAVWAGCYGSTSEAARWGCSLRGRHHSWRRPGAGSQPCPTSLHNPLVPPCSSIPRRLVRPLPQPADCAGHLHAGGVGWWGARQLCGIESAAVACRSGSPAHLPLVRGTSLALAPAPCSWPCACSAQWPTTFGSSRRARTTTTWRWTCMWRATGRTRWPRSASPSSPFGSCSPTWSPSRSLSPWRSSSSGRSVGYGTGRAAGTVGSVVARQGCSCLPSGPLHTLAPPTPPSTGLCVCQL